MSSKYQWMVHGSCPSLFPRLWQLSVKKSARWSRSASTVISHSASMYPWHDGTRTALFLCDLPPITHPNWRKTPGKLRRRDKTSGQYATKLSRSSKTKVEKHHNQRSLRDMARTCNTGSWMGSWNRLGEIWGNLNKEWALVNNNISILGCSV